jgi:MEMO1 family protein
MTEPSRASRLLRLAMVLFGFSACAERNSDRAASATTGHRALTATNQPKRAETRPAAPPPKAESPSQVTTGRVRAVQKAGTWYPDDPAWALAEMHRMFRVARAAPRLEAKPIALVVPHAGWRYSGVAAAAAFGQLHRGDFTRVVLLGPSHGHAFEGFALPDFDIYQTPLGPIPVCSEAAELRDGQLLRDIPEADRGEHSLELELPWLKQSLGPFCLIPIIVGSTNAASERELASRLGKLKNDLTLFVVSSDFVHYGPRFDYMPFGTSVSGAQTRIFELENQAIGLLGRRDAGGFRQLIQSTQATICGYRGQLVLLELLAKLSTKPSAVTLAHYSSAELPPERDNERDESGSVGYVALGYVNRAPSNAKPMGAPSPVGACSAQDEVAQGTGVQLLELAKAALSTRLLGTDELDRAFGTLPLTPRLDCRQAVFVTLKSRGELRGCVGQVEPEYPLAEAVVRSALDSALNDRRFEPVTAEEFAGLSFELTVLSVPHEVASYRDIVLGKHGIILSSRGRRALFLPQVPGEQGWGLLETLRALANKAGLPEEAWKEQGAKFSVFTGQVFEEPTKPGRSAGGKLGKAGGS